MFLEEKLELILKKLEEQEKMMKLFIPDLTKKKEVEHFLQITRQTMKKYLDENLIKKDEHYYLDDDGAMVFIPEAVMELKAKGIKYKGSKVSNTAKADQILEQMGVRL